MKPIGTKTITTARLVLRAPQRSDAIELVQARSLAMSCEEAQKALQNMVDELKHPFVFHWVITLDGHAIGRVKGWEVNPYDGYLQLGYDVGPDYRGCGYMTEAVRAVIDYMVHQAEANRVFCSVRESNLASRRVCEKCGMQLEGVMRQHYARQDGGYDDVRIYGIVKSDLLGKGDSYGA